MALQALSFRLFAQAVILGLAIDFFFFFVSSVAVEGMAVASRLNRMELGGISQALQFNLFSGKVVKRKKQSKPLVM